MTVPLDRHYRVESHASPESAARLRRIVAAHLRYWGLDPHAEPVSRGIGELLANVHRQNVHRQADDATGHPARCVIELRWSGRHLTASVEDGGPRMPRLLTAGDGGLARVAALSDSWGTCATPLGKVVWFTRSVRAPQYVLRLPPSPLRPLDTALDTALPDPAPVLVLR
jgi:hypothetical protein